MNYKRKRSILSRPHKGYSTNGWRCRRGLKPILEGQTYRDVDWPKEFHGMSNWPKWHDVLYNVRPRRREWKMALTKVRKGIDPDGIAFPLYKKPHVYYW